MTSSSVQSSSSASKSPCNSGQTLKKKFVCVWPSCGKSFSRSEHLHRHALNHKEGNNTCTRCAAHFRRRDLLDRHMIRHKEKDDEAGGEGLGHLATRKRLWRDANGVIVNARRPNRPDGVKKRQMTSSSGSGRTSQGRKDSSSSSQASAPPSPPTSLPSTEGLVNTDHVDNGIFQDSWPPMDHASSSHTDCVDPFDFLCNASWGNQPFQPFVATQEGLPYDDIFKPDTAMSFNAPFTTMSYYSWLFENEPQHSGDAATQPQVNYNGSSLDPVLLAASNPQQKSHETPFMETMKANDGLSSSLQDMRNYIPNTRESTGFPSELSADVGSTPVINDQTFKPEVSLQYNYSTAHSSGPSDSNGMDFDSTTNQSLYSTSHNPDMTYSANTSMSQISTPPGQRAGSVCIYPSPDAYTTRNIAKLPIMTNAARDGLMQVISQSRPTKPDGSEIVSSDPLLSLSSLQHYSDLFFTRFNSSYPLIHQATFQSDQVHTYLLMSILLLGATYSDKEAHLLAVCVHDVMRPLIHASKEFGTRPKLWMLQTILLVECFGKSRAGEKQHDMSHLYHGMLINLIRRSDCQTAFIQPFEQGVHDPQEYWKMAVEAEQKRRLALLCFMWDTQHAVLFSQSLCMNASELLLTLPWDPAAWEASSASEWFMVTQNTPQPPSYLSILKMYTNANKTSPPPHLNALSRVLILHGLMSISWDLSRRDQTSLSLSLTASSSLPWQRRISNCYTNWKLDFDAYTAAVLSSLSFSPTSKDKFQRFAVANLAVYHTAQLILEVDIIDLQINAGARHIIGRPVTPADIERSRAKISHWIHRDGGLQAGRAACHAGRLFRDGVRKLENWNVDEMFHYPWCLYLSTLVCWTFHDAAIAGSRAQNGGPSLVMNPRLGHGLDDEDPDDEDSDWDARAEMNALISGLTRLDPEGSKFGEEVWAVGGKYRTGGLVRCMVKQLNTIRWAVVREGMIVLRGLNSST